MAISIANLTSGVDADGGSTSTSASITLTNNRLGLCGVMSRTGITANPNIPTITGWTTIDSQLYDTSSSSRRRISLLRRLTGSDSTGALTIDFGGQNQTDVIWTFDEASGIDTSGTNGSGAIVQIAKNSDETGSNTSITATLAAFSSVDNIAYGVFGTDGNATWTAGSGFTVLAQRGSGINLGGCSEWKNSNDTTVDATVSAAGFLGCIGIEIKAAVTTSVKDLIGGFIPFAR